MSQTESQKKDYRNTLNLPKTDFPMKAGLSQKEPVLLKQWKQRNLYHRLRQKRAGGPRFLLHDGPPYANGHIHIGHALNKILKDIIVRMKGMQGYDAPFVPGWDCHGLPIEHQLFKQLKKRKSEVDPLTFRHQAHEYAMTFVAVQSEEFQRLGVLGDWEQPYLTLDPEYEYWILHSLARLNKEGYITRGLKPVNWCSHCETALAEAEVEYEQHRSPSIYVKFRVLRLPDACVGDIPDKNKPIFLLVWTTTPWTLLANVAAAVHPGFRYVLVDVGQELWIVARSRWEALREMLGFSSDTVVAEWDGAQLEGGVYQHPFDKRDDCRVVPADFVSADEGTGIVHIAPGHGAEDFELGLRHRLPVLMPVDDQGVFTKEGSPFEGRHVFAANEDIIAHLEQQGCLVGKGEIEHAYPHCWRCKRPVIFRATHQWFLSIDHRDLRRRLLEAVDTVTWIPAAGRERIASMIAHRPDWCLSRQRHWGVPIPALVCRSCGEEVLETAVIERVAQRVKHEGSDVWFKVGLDELVPSDFHCPRCRARDWDKSMDILDVWFDSGVSHQAVIAPRLGTPLPVEMYLEGSDQHRGWFQSSLIPSVAMDGRAPYKSVLTHGFVVDGSGRKMSKSLGNVIAPQQVWDRHGADILRWWAASSHYHEDVRLSDEILQRVVDAYRKLRNTLRFLLANLYDFSVHEHAIPCDQMPALDRWMLDRLVQVVGRLRQAYEAYDFAEVCRLLTHFCNEDLSAFYLDILKDRLYTSSAFEPPRRSAQTVLWHLADHLIKFIAPILVFTAEEAFSHFKGPQNEESVHEQLWPQTPKAWEAPALRERFGTLQRLRPYVMRALEQKRKEGLIGSSLEASLIFETADPMFYEFLNGFGEDLATIFIVSSASVQRCDAHSAPMWEGEFAHTRVRIQRATGEKCARCWKHRPDVGQHPESPDLCSACHHVVTRLSGV